MKIEKWTLGLAAIGLVTLAPSLVAQTGTAPQLVPVEAALSATTISGYVDTSAVWNPGTGNAHAAPYAFNQGKQDGFNLNAVDLKVSKALDETEYAAGFVAELSYGPDAQAIDAGAYPIRQAYVELKLPVGNGINLQIGRWDALLGYESSDSYKNPNYTRTYGKTFEPTEDTGLLASYKYDSIELQAGVSDTFNTELSSINARSGLGSPAVESKKAVVAAVTLTAPDSWGSLKDSKLVGGFSHGQGIYGHDTTEYYAGTTLNTPMKDLTVGASFDLIEHNTEVVPVGVGLPPVTSFNNTAVDAGYIEAFAGYVSYKVDKLTLSARYEYAQGDALQSLGSAVVAAPGGVSAVDFNPGFNKVMDVTGTLQYQLWDNVVSRLEVRWDHAADGSTPFGAINPTTGIGGTKANEVTIAANVIYKF